MSCLPLYCPMLLAAVEIIPRMHFGNSNPARKFTLLNTRERICSHSTGKLTGGRLALKTTKNDSVPVQDVFKWW